MNFFTDGPRERPLFPVPEQELYAYEGRPWTGPPGDHIVPAMLPWVVQLARSERTVVALRGVEVWPEAATLCLSVYSRDSLLADAPRGTLIDHRRVPDYNALLIGVLFADGSRASSETISVPSATEPEAPVLRAQGRGGSAFHFDHEVFVWPLPPPGPMKLIVQWLDRGIRETQTRLDGGAIRGAAPEAGELWPGLHRRTPNELPARRVGGQVAITHQTVTGEATTEASPSPLPSRGPGATFARRNPANGFSPGKNAVTPERHPES
ncbi:hypothetical protein [Amycolatopsis sp. NPDC059021]|uniref:hypothetical protein n=1 Tax=Amycolatopsis sp. NPDC059021 TaxID=3346704 RepID=UPI00366D4E15